MSRKVEHIERTEKFMYFDGGAFLHKRFVLRPTLNS